MKHSSLLLIVICIAAFILLAGYGAGPANVAMNHFIGAPGGTGTTCGTCHNGGNFGAVSSNIRVYNVGTVVPATAYIAGNTYDLEVEITHQIGSPTRFGFQLIALLPNDVQAGTFTSSQAGTSIINLANGVEVVEHSSFNTSSTFTVQWVAPNSGSDDITFYSGGIAANGNGVNSGDRGSTAPTTLVLPLDTNPQIPTITVSLDVLLEGPYNETSGMMETFIYQRDLFPLTGQPYNTAPWNYMGMEGAGWTQSDYPPNVVDWVLVSLRTAEGAASTTKQAAGLLMDDGTVNVTMQFPNGNTQPAYYVVVEHHNHLPAMSPTLVPVINGEIKYNYTTADSYSSGSGFGQTNIGSNWLMFAGNGDQTTGTGHEINGADIIDWFAINGSFDLYSQSDFDLNGDINANDRVKFARNNGFFSAVPKQ